MRKTITKNKIQTLTDLINYIPNMRAVQVANETWKTEFPNEFKNKQVKKAIANINGVLKMFEYADDTEWQLTYAWNYKNYPTTPEDHIPLPNFPISIITDVTENQQFKWYEKKRLLESTPDPE